MAASKLLVLNSGSSSLKFKLFQLAGGTNGDGLTAIASGICERVGDAANSTLKVHSAAAAGTLDAHGHLHAP